MLKSNFIKMLNTALLLLWMGILIEGLDQVLQLFKMLIYIEKNPNNSQLSEKKAFISLPNSVNNVNFQDLRQGQHFPLSNLPAFEAVPANIQEQGRR